MQWVDHVLTRHTSPDVWRGAEQSGRDYEPARIYDLC
jgi:hypothetical protein